VLEISEKTGVPVCVRFTREGEWQPNGDDLKGIYLAIMDKTLVESYTGHKLRDMEDGIAASRILNDLGISIAVTIFPDQGITLTGKGETVTVPILPTQGRIDGFTLDVLAAGLISGILQGFDFRQVLRLSLGIAFRKDGKSRNLHEQQEKQ